MTKKSKVTILGLLSFSAAVLCGQSFASNGNPQIYQCEYRAAKQGGNEFVMAGNIVLSDIDTTSDSETYLTLEPPQLSDIDVTARVLITYWTDNGGYYYNPMTLHPRGNTAHALASALLSGNEQHVGYFDSAKQVNYTLECKLK